MKYIIAAIFPALILCIAALSAINQESLSYNNSNIDFESVHSLPLPYEYKPVGDTVFIQGRSFIEISLSEQRVYLHVRGDSVRKMKISTGNSRLNKGKDTPTGIYSVQSKTRLTTSKQFNNAKLFNWIGFNYNIGFHGLEGNSYYRTLGITPSSHGCVRIGREDGDTLYKYVKVGTPVLVYKGKPARPFTFDDNAQIDLNKDIIIGSAGKSSLKRLKQRLSSLYHGNYFLDVHGRLFMDGKTALRPGGYSIGLFDRLPFHQQNPIDLPIKSALALDNLHSLLKIPEYQTHYISLNKFTID